MFLLLAFILCFTDCLSSHENSYVDQGLWNHLLPYFLPENHPIKPELDRIFSASRVTANAQAVKDAGFKNNQPGKWSRVIVSKHPKLSGYVIKLYTDDQLGITEWINWEKRILGAQEIQKAIAYYGSEDIFKVPKKWIYPLPTDPPPLPGSERRHFILIAEDMRILSKKASLKKWQSSKMTPKKLLALFIILKEVGLWDTVHAFNLPFAKDGKLAFIDTEFYHTWPVPYHRLTKYLSDDCQSFWKELTAHYE